MLQSISKPDEFNARDSVWPDLRSSPIPSHQRFWEYEWVNHGSCSENLYSQPQYFALAIALKNQLNLLDVLRKIQIYPGNVYAIAHLNSSITTAIGKVPDLTCSYRQNQVQPYPGVMQLQEIAICYDQTGSRMINCPADKFVEYKKYKRSSACTRSGNRMAYFA
ncbi:hypothetical protein ACH5RR_011308 [Cinchona calisaya]|uniref:S-RNase n=1 Tax=Cinchona calisaya TaxID=153742 RepID=A0ABD3A845_9GENT